MRRCVVVGAVLMLCWCPSLSAQPRAGAPQASGGAFATGQYRNLFREAGHADEAIRKKIDAAFQQLFHGDPATQAVFYWAGENANGRLAYLSDINNRDVRSEGMSYGMMIAVQLNKKAEFDALWNWSRTFMFHDDPAHPAYGFFSWSMKTDGTPNSESPAPDGEEYYAMALYFASARWGDGSGIYDYRADGGPAAPGHEEPRRHHRPVGLQVRPHRDRRRPVQPRTQDGAVHARQQAGGSHRSVVPPAGVLRAVGQVGPGGRPAVLGGGGARQPRLPAEGHASGHRPGAGVRELRCDAGDRQPQPAVRDVRAGRLAHGGELVGGLVVVGGRPARAGAQRSHPGVFRIEGPRRRTATAGRWTGRPSWSRTTRRRWSRQTPSPASPPRTRVRRGSSRRSGTRTSRRASTATTTGCGT